MEQIKLIAHRKFATENGLISYNRYFAELIAQAGMSAEKRNKSISAINRKLMFE